MGQIIFCQKVLVIKIYVSPGNVLIEGFFAALKKDFNSVCQIYSLQFDSLFSHFQIQQSIQSSFRT